MTADDAAEIDRLIALGVDKNQWEPSDIISARRLLGLKRRHMPPVLRTDAQSWDRMTQKRSGSTSRTLATRMPDLLHVYLKIVRADRRDLLPDHWPAD